MNFTEPILRQAKLQPHHIAIIDGDRNITYGELTPLVLRTATHLSDLGVQPGDRVGIGLRDGWEYLVTLLAVGCMGAVFAPLDSRAPPAEAARIGAQLGVKFALVEPRFRANVPFPAIPVDSTWHSKVDAAELYEAPRCDWNAPFHIDPSSGTTSGTPNVALHTHLQYYFMVAAMLELLSPPRHSRALCVSPLCFVSGRYRCLSHLSRGDTMIVHSAVTGAEYVELVQRLQVNVGTVFPYLLRQLLQLADGKEYLLPGMTNLSCAGAPLRPEEKLAAARELTPNFFENYSTAATGVIAMLRSDDLASHTASVGRPHPMAVVEIVDDEHQPVGPDTFGRLRYRGPGMGRVLPGFGRELRNQEFYAGWYYPGEYAAIDEEGYIFVKGRTSEVITRGGAKIHPSEIESVLCSHPAVLEAAVIGRNPGTDAEEIVAFVVTRKPVEGGELIAHCRTHLTPYKVPTEVFAVAELPRRRSGKIDVRTLRERLDSDASP